MTCICQTLAIRKEIKLRQTGYRLHSRSVIALPCAAVALLMLASMLPADPVVPGFTVTTYAAVTDPVRLAPNVSDEAVGGMSSRSSR